MNSKNSQRATYQIAVQGELDQGWKQWFDELAVTTSFTGDQPVTTLFGPVADQVALRGIVCKLWDLNLIVISVRRVTADNEEERYNG